MLNSINCEPLILKNVCSEFILNFLTSIQFESVYISKMILIYSETHTHTLTL